MNVLMNVYIFILGLLLCVELSQARATSKALSEEEEEETEDRKALEKKLKLLKAEEEHRRKYPEEYGNGVQGDMLIPVEEIEANKKRLKEAGKGKYRSSVFNSVYFPYYGWNYYGLGIIPYYCTPDFKSRTAAEGNGTHTPYQVFLDTIAYIKNEIACVQFVPVQLDGSQPYYVLVDYGDSGCQAEIGFRQKSGQTLDLGQYCTLQRGTVCHELMHVMGFYHEQTRQDRDAAVTVHLENVVKTPVDRTPQFDIVGTTYVEMSSTYDCASVMHYSRDAFSIDKVTPMKTIEGHTQECENQMGQRDGFSVLDTAAMVAKYGPACPS